MQTCMSKNVVNCNSVTVELPTSYQFAVYIQDTQTLTSVVYYILIVDRSIYVFSHCVQLACNVG